MNQKAAKQRLVKAICVLLVIFVLIFLLAKQDLIKDYMSLGSILLPPSVDFDNTFNDEVLDINQVNAKDVKQSSNHNVVGFLLPHNSKSSFLILKEKLLQNGWKFFESQSDTCGSFYKGQGKYSWLFLICTDMGDETSVVITAN